MDIHQSRARACRPFGGPLMKVWKMVKNRAAVLRHFAFLADVVRLDAHQRIFREGGEGVIRLVGQDVPVGQEQDAWTAGRFAAQVPTAVKELPGNLKRDEGFAGAGGEREQDTLACFPP